MRKKILFAIITVSLLMMIVCAGLVMGIVYDYLGKKIDTELSDQAIMVEEGWRLGGEEYLNLAEKRTDITSRISVITPTGEVIFDSMVNPENMENHLEREEVKEALADGIGKAVRTSKTLSKTTRYYAIKAFDGNIIRLSTTHYSQLGFFLDTFGMILVAVALLLALGFIISQRVTSGIIKPINAIDIDNPDIDEHYEELAPLLHRIKNQNHKIAAQMADLRKGREEFQIITERMREGIVIINKEGKILSYNKSAAEKLDFDLRGKENTFEDALKLNRSETFRNAIEEALAGRNYNGNMESHGMSLQMFASPVIEEQRVSGAIIMILDVTEKERGEKLRREFTSNVSHELKTPVTSIYGIADMMAGGMVKAEDIQSFAKNIKDESARLISLIDDILKLSRLDEGSFEKSLTPVDLRAVTENVVERLKTKAGESGVELSFDFIKADPGSAEDDEKALVAGHENILDEIVHNICENAIKYNGKGGYVKARLEPISGRWVLEVSDDGIGIPSGDLERVFERFYRVDKSHSKKIGGTGLGLSIVKHGVAYVGGEIDIESREGEGTKVTVIFPMAHQQYWKIN